MPVMSHPDLPGRTITVAPRAVEVHERSGWQLDKPETDAPKRKRSRTPAPEPDPGVTDADTPTPDSEEE